MEPTVRQQLAEFVKVYDLDFGADGYSHGDLVDYVVSVVIDPKTPHPDYRALVAWYRRRAAALERRGRRPSRKDKAHR